MTTKVSNSGSRDIEKNSLARGEKACTVTGACETKRKDGRPGEIAFEHRSAEGVSYADWYVGQSPPTYGAQHKAINRCAALGFKAWLPQIVDYRLVRTRGGRNILFGGKPKREEIRRPLFGAYWFVSFDINDPGWGKILHDDKVVSRILCDRTAGGLSPRRLPYGFVEAMQNLGRAGDGVLPHKIAKALEDQDWSNIGTIPVDPNKPPLIPPMTPGVILDGPFSSFHATVHMDMGKRIWVMATIFGRTSPVELDRHQFEVR